MTGRYPMPQSATWGAGRTGPPSAFGTRLSGITSKVFDALKSSSQAGATTATTVLDKVRDAVSAASGLTQQVGGAMYNVGSLGEALGGGSAFGDLAERGYRIHQAGTHAGLEFDAKQMETISRLNKGIESLSRTEQAIQGTIAREGRPEMLDPSRITAEEFLAMPKDEAKARFFLTDAQYDELVRKLKAEGRHVTPSGKRGYTTTRRPVRKGRKVFKKRK